MHLVNFKSSDGVVFELDKNAVEMSKTFRTMVETIGNKNDGVILLKKFNSTILRLIVNWMNHHVNDPFPDDERRIEGFRDDYYSSELYDYDLELLKDCSVYTLFQLSLAANFLDVDGLLIFASMGIANLLKDKNLSHLKAKIDSCIRCLNLKVTEDMSAEEKEIVEYLHAVEEMQVHIDEVVDFEPMNCLGVNDRLNGNNIKLTKEQEEEEIEWAKKVSEMQADIDKVVVFDPVACRRMSEPFDFNETNNTLEKELEDIANVERESIIVDEWDEEEWRHRVEEMQEDIDQIVDFGTIPMAG